MGEDTGDSARLRSPMVYSPTSSLIDTGGASQLISNLDHEIPEIRLRALKCLKRKLETGVITNQYLCKRLDLPHRLGFRSSKWTEEEILSIIELLSLMCKFPEFRKNFLNTQLEALLSKARYGKGVGVETRAVINRFLDSIRTIDFLLEGPAENWNDNYSIPLSTARRASRSCSAIVMSARDEKSSSSEQLIGRPFNGFLDHQENGKLSNWESGDPETYFLSSKPSYSRDWIKTADFGIPRIRLDVVDRKLLSSTVESLLSKKENLVLVTSCFIRDVLLNDFPAETFVQEGALCLGLLQVLEEPWEENLTYVAFQTLFKLSNCLQARFQYLNSSNFYGGTQVQHDHHVSSDGSRQSHSTSRNVYSPNSFASCLSSTDSFLNNLCEVVKNLSRSLAYNCRNRYMWILLCNFTETLTKCINIFRGDPKSFSLNLQDILLDLSQCYLKNSGWINPSVLALIISSVLECFPEKDSFILTKDIRRTIWDLASDSRLYNESPHVFHHFARTASSFEANIDKVHSPSFGHPQWSSQVLVQNILHDIQNATEHEHVLKAVGQLWEQCIPLVLNSRSPCYPEEGMSIDQDIVVPNLPWRETLYRFLSVEPTSAQDEDLLVRIMDLLHFLIKEMADSSQLRKWIVPLVTEKGSSVLRLLSQHCGAEHGASGMGTTLPNVIRSIFDLYHLLILRGDYLNPEQMWEILSSFIQIFNKLAEAGFSSTALANSVLSGISQLTMEKTIFERLVNSREIVLALLDSLSECLQCMETRCGGGPSYRNHGVIYYAAMSVLHLCLVIEKATRPSWNIALKCVQLVPFLIRLEEARIRSIAFQICSVVGSSKGGTFFLLSALESPSFLWSSAYTHFVDPREVPTVRHKAGIVVLNLLKYWDVMKSALGRDVLIPRAHFLEDILGLIPNIYWHPALSVEFKKRNENENQLDISGDYGGVTPIITPKVLSVISRQITFFGTHVDSKNLNDQVASELSVETIFRELCIALIRYRILGNHQISSTMDGYWLIDVFTGISDAVEALNTLLLVNKRYSLLIITDKFNLITLIRLLNLSPVSGENTDRSRRILSLLWVNILVLLTILCEHAGQNWEDLERVLWSQRNVIFLRLVDWLEAGALVKCRRVAIEFINVFLCQLMENHKYDVRIELLLCQLWRDRNVTYGVAVCQRLLPLLENSNLIEDRVPALRLSDTLFQVSPSAKSCAVKKDMIKILIQILETLENDYMDISHSQGFKNNSSSIMGAKGLVKLLGTLFYNCPEAREFGYKSNLANTLHNVFKAMIQNNPDRSFLHSLILCLTNYTAEFPRGSQSLTMTSGVTGVPARKIATPNSFYIELLHILQKELDLIDKTPNLKTVELLMSFIKNTAFSIDCRNILYKTQILIFLRKLHPMESNKWGPDQQHIRRVYFDLVEHLTAFPDMQLFIAKINDAVEIITLFSRSDNPKAALPALRIIRNLCFNSGNRVKLLNHGLFLQTLSEILKFSEDKNELEFVATIVWTLTNNCEKGKVVVKRSGCVQSLTKAIQRLNLKESASNDLAKEKCDFSNVIKLMKKVSSILVS